MTVTVRLTGERHRVASVDADPRVVTTACGLRVVRGSGRCDPTSAYQRAVFPPCGQRTDCGECRP